MDRKKFAEMFGPALAKAQRKDAYNAAVKRLGNPEPPIFRTVLEDMVNARGFEHMDDYTKKL